MFKYYKNSYGVVTYSEDHYLSLPKHVRECLIEVKEKDLEKEVRYFEFDSKPISYKKEHLLREVQHLLTLKKELDSKKEAIIFIGEDVEEIDYELNSLEEKLEELKSINNSLENNNENI